MNQASQTEVLDEHRQLEGTATQPLRTPVSPRSGAQRTLVRRRRFIAPSPPSLAWYEYLPAWVSISIFLHGLALLMAIVVIASPETFGIASEGSVDRNNVVQVAQFDALGDRIVALEQQSAIARGGSGATDGGASDALAQRLAALEARLAAVCARATPPC